jgi:hypothetical protein
MAFVVRQPRSKQPTWSTNNGFRLKAGAYMPSSPLKISTGILACLNYSSQLIKRAIYIDRERATNLFDRASLIRIIVNSNPNL